MQTLLTSLSYLAVSQLLLTCLFYLSYYRDSKLGIVVTLLCVCLMTAVWSPFAGTDFLIAAYIDGRIAAATPAILWLFAHTLFTDEKRIPAFVWILLIGYQIPRGFVAFPAQIYDFSANPILQVLNPICLAIAFGLALHVIIMAVKDLGNDLLEDRRRLRAPFAAGLGLVMALLVSSLLVPELASPEFAASYSQFAAALSRLLTFSFFLAFNLMTFELSTRSKHIIGNSVAQQPDSHQKSPQLDESDIALTKELDRIMREQKPFAKPELTIGELAKTLSVQEYKLRLIINRELGYRNFNQFLNKYRIEEACILLKKESEFRNISIVAQDVGYSSLSTFNQAFRKLQGLTPSEFKAKYSPKPTPSK